MKIAIWTARILLAAVFLYAGVFKLGISERFAVTVAHFSILPPAVANVFAFSLGWIETLTGLLLLIPRTSRLGAGLATLLLATFLAALAWSLSQGFVVDCGCFGEDPEPSRDKMIFAIWRDAALLVLTLGLACRRTR
ncbi:MAG: DoxX family membrane protein [Terrimicrobiaceae bacterium]|nr:DoxX family membrane protein [Terrimicrobiaceae bacterium]